MKHILHSVPFDWAWLVTSLGLVEGLFVGFAICFPVAFLVLLIATRNIFMAFIAILNVIFIVAGVLGYCSMAGWALGASSPRCPRLSATPTSLCLHRSSLSYCVPAAEASNLHLAPPSSSDASLAAR